MLQIVGYVTLLSVSILAIIFAQPLQPTVNSLIGPPPTATPEPHLVVAAAESAYHSGDLAIAAELYGEAARISPTDMEILAPYGRILVLNNQLDEALAVAEQMIALNPEDARGYAVKARALDWQGHYQDAVVASLKAVELDPNSAQARAYLAEAYADLGRLRQASEQAELAIQLDPYNVDARRNYGYVLEFYGDYAGAIQQYQQAQTIEPNMLELWYGLARNYRGARQSEEAIATFNQIANRTPDDPNIYLELGKTYFEMREDDAAQENLSQAVELVCEDCPLYDSADILEDALYNAPGGDEKFFSQQRPLPATILMSAWNRLGQVYSTRRNYESAIAILEEAIACGTRSQCGVTPDQIPIESYYVSASDYFYLDKCNLAVDHADKALKMWAKDRVDNADTPPDTNTLSTILCVFKLCRDDADTPVTYSAPGFTNGLPDGYEEPDCRITRGAVTDDGGDTGDESTPAAP